MLLLGTTDSLFEDDPDELRVTEEDVETVLAEAAVALDGDFLRRDAVRAAFAGLRVLPNADGDTATARRETTFLRGRTGMLSIAGGKLTGYRRIATNALTALRSDFGLRRVERTPAPLPGAAEPDAVSERLANRHPAVEPRVRDHLARLYGALAEEVVMAARGDEALLAPLAAGAPDIGAQVVYAFEHEWACTTDDVVLRRTTLGYRGAATREAVARVEALARAARGWAGGASRPQVTDCY
jgi:glycerol-3-phosphate dehydrogenase